MEGDTAAPVARPVGPKGGPVDAPVATARWETVLEAARRLAGRHPAAFRIILSGLAGAFVFKAGAMPDGVWPGLMSAGTSPRLPAGGVCAIAEIAAALAAGSRAEAAPG